MRGGGGRSGAYRVGRRGPRGRPTCSASSFSWRSGRNSGRGGVTDFHFPDLLRCRPCAARNKDGRQFGRTAGVSEVWIDRRGSIGEAKTTLKRGNRQIGDRERAGGYFWLTVLRIRGSEITSELKRTFTQPDHSGPIRLPSATISSGLRRKDANLFLPEAPDFRGAVIRVGGGEVKYLTRRAPINLFRKKRPRGSDKV